MSTTTTTAIDMACLKEAARDLGHVARSLKPDQSSKTYRGLAIAALRDLHAGIVTERRMRNIRVLVLEVLEEEGF
jgi:hypothetical protein